MILTATAQKLVNDAIAAGYNYEQFLSSIKLTKGSGCFPKGLVIYEDRTAYRTDVSVSDALTIRTYKEMRRILGI